MNDFTHTPQFKKGRAGERFCAKYLEEKHGYKIYIDARQQVETADILAMKDNYIQAYHVKTKPPFSRFPHLQGIDLRHYREYLDVQKKNPGKHWLVFVDDENCSMYCISLRDFEKYSWQMKDKFQVVEWQKYCTTMCRVPKKEAERIGGRN